METYILRRLKENDLREFRFIAQIHESIPGGWTDNYSINAEEIEITIERLIEKHKTQGIVCFVAEEDNVIISFIWAEINENDKETIDIFSLWTDEKYRGHGIASNLKIELEKWIKTDTNAKRISTTVSTKNNNMIALNEKLGYKIMYHKMIKKI